jgi:hypothetical protein
MLRGIRRSMEDPYINNSFLLSNIEQMSNLIKEDTRGPSKGEKKRKRNTSGAGVGVGVLSCDVQSREKKNRKKKTPTAGMQVVRTLPNSRSQTKQRRSHL